MSGIITLLTDFGDRDAFVGVVKGVALSRFSDAKLVDLTHGIRPGDVAAASLWLERSFRWFPEGTVHLAVVDPGVGTSRAALAASAEGHLFVGPDNGILARVLDRCEKAGSRVEARRIELRRFNIGVPSHTFHGRDVFAPVAAELAAKRVAFAEVGPLETRIAPSPVAEPSVKGGQIHGEVVIIDRFGNLITNIQGADVARLARPSIEIQTEVPQAPDTARPSARPKRIPFRSTYSDVPVGKIVALVNSFDLVEIAVRGGNAADHLGVKRGTVVVIGEDDTRPVSASPRSVRGG